MNRFAHLACALAVLFPATAAALTDAEREARFAACFDFAALVPGGTVEPHWLDDGSLWYVVDDGDTLRVDPATGGRAPFSPPPVRPKPAVDPMTSPDGAWTAFTQGDDLWLRSASDDSVLVARGDEDHPWFLWGALWSPDGRHLAVLQYDLSTSPTVPIVDWLDPSAPVEQITTSRCDLPRPRPRLAVVHAPGDRVVRVHEDPDFAEPLLHPAGWVPGTGNLLVVRFDRTMGRQDLLAVDPATGATTTLIAERTDTFIDGLAASFMLDDYLTPVDDDAFVWLSERDGYHHLYLYGWDGSLVRRLTRGDYPVLRIEAVDADAGQVYFMAKPDPDDPTSRHLCRVGMDGGDFRRLTELPGRRRIHLAPDFGCFVDNHSDLDRPPHSVLRRTDGAFVAELAAADDSVLASWEWNAPRRTTAKAADRETDCFCAIYLPPGFDPELKYPVVEVIYAGPQWMIVPRRLPAGEYGDTAAALAQLGYVAVIIDSPGTAGVGKAYQDAVHEKLGTIEIPDHVAALRDLARTRPWMDLERVGVHGKSWGGYFTLRAMLMAPEFYRVGVASGPVADLATTSESAIVPYMGLPAENPDAYAAADCLPLAGELAGDLLITIGTVDVNTPFGQSMRMLSAFTEAEKDAELLVFPGQHHWLQGASFTRWQRALRDFFREHLPPVPLPRS